MGYFIVYNQELLLGSVFKCMWIKEMEYFTDVLRYPKTTIYNMNTIFEIHHLIREELNLNMLVCHIFYAYTLSWKHIVVKNNNTGRIIII